MAYKNGGESHWEGVANEEYVVEKLNKELIEKPKFREFLSQLTKESITNFLHFGKTKRKDDAGAMHGNEEVIKISIKNHKKKNATLDYMNSSDYAYFFGDYKAKVFKDELRLIRDTEKAKLPDAIEGKTTSEIASMPEMVKEIKKVIEETRIKCKELFLEILKSIDSDVIKKILLKVKKEEVPLLAIRDAKIPGKGKISLIKREDRGDFRDVLTFDDSDKFEIRLLTYKNGKPKYSSRILKNGTDTGIRIRILLNNGIEPLIGHPLKGTDWKGNRNSELTIHVQNDQVIKWLDATSYVVE